MNPIMCPSAKSHSTPIGGRLWRCIFIVILVALSQQSRTTVAWAAESVASPAADQPASTQSATSAASLSALQGLALGDWLPESLSLGSLRVGPLRLTPTLNAQLDWFAEGNNGWGGKFSPPLERSRYFFEHSNEGGLNAALGLARYGEVAGRVSAIFAMTGGGLNAEATNYGDIQARNYSIEDAYLEWRSGDLFPSLGHDAVSVIGGRYTYQIGDGFLFYNGASGGGNLDAAWLAPHHAFAQTGIVRLQSHGATVEGFYLSPSDHPYRHTEMAGVNTELRLSELIEAGFTYANIFHSDTPERQRLNLLYGRVDGRPLRALRNFYLAASFAIENSRTLTNALGWYVTPSYTLSRLPWQPILYYRYASFSGGGHNGGRDFDPLFDGSSDWGTWTQGEILGNWIATNSNLDSDQVRLNLSPDDKLNLNVIYYHFLLDSRAQNLVSKSAGPLTSKNLADEVDLTADLSITNWWSMAITFSVNIPGTAAREISGGSQTWVQSCMWSNWQF